MELAKEGFNLIEQCEGLNAWPLLKALLKTAVKTWAPQVIIFSDRPILHDDWEFLIPSTVRVVDLYANFFKNLNSESCFIAQLEDYFKTIDGEQSVVVLDCLESLLMCYGQVVCIQLLHRLFTDGCRRAWVLIGSVEELSDDFLAHLRSLARKVHRLSLESDNGHVVYQEICHNNVRRTWDFQIDSSYNFISAKRRVEVKKKPTSPTDPTVATVAGLPRDIESGVPFRLALNAKEWEARSKVKLPYKKDSAQSGKVYYVADADDDVDDEDPDEDLVI
ncbi:hypothetical protein TTRE_0000305201 [Trichuris trichiura]|uniref:Elongator complex protein 5 n=1 Tax=Trichuris trichiura TaxID=36087 RepID=A0A077Z2T7_TRITR|nr:hypothetical protein TTRE_0000305201 [Trichuris trichiura]